MAEQEILTPFELINIVSFYYSIELPSKSMQERITSICFKQFEKIYKMMECIELCKILKYMSSSVWRRKDLTEAIIELFEVEADSMPYRDIMPVVATLINSNIKNKRTKILIVKLMERKKKVKFL